MGRDHILYYIIYKEVRGMRKFLSVLLSGITGSVLLAAFLLSPVTVMAAPSVSSDSVVVSGKYVIPDSSGTSTRYVLVATNEFDMDIAIEAKFYAIDADNNLLYRAIDFAEAVKAGQEFMLYGQFPQEIADQTDHVEYTLSVNEADNCAYNAASVTATEGNDNLLVVEGTNYSNNDIQGINVRTVFLKNGKAVGFGTVNIADYGYTLCSGSTNTQELGQFVSDYDSYILTYTTCMP